MKHNKIIEFTEENVFINNFGLYIIKDTEETKKIFDKKIIERVSYLSTVCYKLVWNQHYKLKNKKYGISNFLTDGWCHFIGDKKELINYLNNSDDKYRILTKQELFFILNNKSNQKQLFLN
jgi:hypothetical protein